jgi:hypothetical protein
VEEDVVQGEDVELGEDVGLEMEEVGAELGEDGELEQGEGVEALEEALVGALAGALAVVVTVVLGGGKLLLRLRKMKFLMSSRIVVKI